MARNINMHQRCFYSEVSGGIIEEAFCDKLFFILHALERNYMTHIEASNYYKNIFEVVCRLHNCVGDGGVEVSLLFF